MEKMVRAQRRVQVVHQVDVGRLVEARALRQHADAREDLLGLGRRPAAEHLPRDEDEELGALAETGEAKAKTVADAIRKYGVDPGKRDPTTV